MEKKHSPDYIVYFAPQAGQRGHALPAAVESGTGYKQLLRDRKTGEKYSASYKLTKKKDGLLVSTLLDEQSATRAIKLFLAHRRLEQRGPILKVIGCDLVGNVSAQ